MLTRQGQEKDGSWHWCSQLAVKEEDSQLPGHRRYKIGDDKYEMSMKFLVIDDMNMMDKYHQSINQVYFRIITNDTYRLLFNESQWFIDAVVIQGQT